MTRYATISLGIVFLITLGLFSLTGCAKKPAADKPAEASLDAGTIKEESLGSDLDGGRKGRSRRGVTARAQAYGPEGIAFESEDIFFDYDQYTLSSEARSLLQKKAGFLKKHPEVQITIEGHCDERGSSDYNLGLGQRRADAVRAYLADLGIPDSRLAAVSYGEEQPAEPGHDESAYARNRRAHLVIGGLTE